jgi:hypothetical protein
MGCGAPGERGDIISCCLQLGHVKISQNFTVTLLKAYLSIYLISIFCRQASTFKEKPITFAVPYL